MSSNQVVVGLSYAGPTGRVVTRDIFFERGGIVGDKHKGEPARQVSLLDWNFVEQRAQQDSAKAMPGLLKENVAVAGLNALPLRLCDELQLGHVVLEVTQLGERFGRVAPAGVKVCTLSREAVFARVRSGGAIRIGAHVHHKPRTLRAQVITMSDRASRGDYEDVSGARAVELLQEWGAKAGWNFEVKRLVLPDERDALENALNQARSASADLVITTGGTGVGPRDITPEVVTGCADRLVPGIMEHIRFKFGQAKPAARLSRSVAALMGETIVLALPGSPRAVEEYLGEITPLLEHLIYTSRGIDPH